MPPVVVVTRGGGACRVALAPAAARHFAGGAWRLDLEGGASLAGRLGDDGAVVVPGRRLALGYHRLHLARGGRAASTTLVVAPRRCYLPPGLTAQWGVTAQLYGIRSGRNWGIGDFADLADLVGVAASAGAACVGLNPLHALLAPASGVISPYSPSSRLFLNALYIAPDRVPEFADSPAAQAMFAAAQPELAALRERARVDHGAIAALKDAVLGALYEAFLDHRRRDPVNPRARAFDAFVAASGAELTRFATFEALAARLLAAGSTGGADAGDWRGWPAAYRAPDGPAVREFAAAHGDRLDRVCYVQWLAQGQLAEAAGAATTDMAVGLYGDLAVGVHPGGAEAWAERALLVPGVSIGAPPDAYSLLGQYWGLAPTNPATLAAQAYRPFAAMLAANMRHAGALRIDHVMGLMRLFWIPDGMAPKAGTYVAYPFADLLRIVALESVRNNCVVVGEDLGTVPPGLRARLRRAGMLSTRLLYFERMAGGTFKPPRRWPKQCAAAVSTHDLPTLRGFWAGSDLAWRARLGLDGDHETVAAATAARAGARTALVAALRKAGLLPPAPPPGGDQVAALRGAAHGFVAAAPCRLMLVQLEDLLDEIEQVNLPGTIDDHPNWRRKLTMPLVRLFSAPVAQALLTSVRAGRQAAARRP